MGYFDQIIADYEENKKALIDAKWILGFDDCGLGHGSFTVISDRRRRRTRIQIPEAVLTRGNGNYQHGKVTGTGIPTGLKIL